MASIKKEEATKEEKMIEKISTFVSLYRKWILIGLSALVVVLLAIVITTSVVDKNNEKAFIRVENLESQLGDMVESSDSSEVDAYLADLEKEIKGSSYKSVKSAYIIGEFYAAKENWSKAYDYFMKAYNLNSKTYLADLSAFNAAVASEEQGDTEKALALYSQVAENMEAPVSAKALFNVARIYLQSGNQELAKVTFQQLIDNFDFSEYSLIAQDVISLM